jgi:hypothetical protein
MIGGNAAIAIEFLAENIVQFNVAGIHMGAIAIFGGTAKFLIHLWQVRFQ